MSLKTIGIAAASVLGALTALSLIGKFAIDKALKQEIAAKQRQNELAASAVVKPVVVAAEPEETLGNWSKGTLSMPKATPVPAEVIEDVVAPAVAEHQAAEEAPKA